MSKLEVLEENVLEHGYKEVIMAAEVLFLNINMQIIYQSVLLSIFHIMVIVVEVEQISESMKIAYIHV